MRGRVGRCVGFAAQGRIGLTIPASSIRRSGRGWARSPGVEPTLQLCEYQGEAEGVLPGLGRRAEEFLDLLRCPGHAAHEVPYAAGT